MVNAREGKKAHPLQQGDMGSLATWMSLEWKGGRESFSPEGHIKESFIQKLQNISWNLKWGTMKKETVFTLDPNLSSFISYFLLVSSTQGLKQKHRSCHLFATQLVFCEKSILSPTYVPNVCHFYHSCLTQTLSIFFIYLIWFPFSLAQPHSNVSSSLLSKSNI